MSEQTIWLVTGCQGAYSDYETWVVRAFDSEGEALQYVTQLTLAVKNVRERFPQWNSKVHIRERDEAMRTIDRPCDEWDVKYYCEPVVMGRRPAVDAWIREALR